MMESIALNNSVLLSSEDAEYVLIDENEFQTSSDNGDLPLELLHQTSNSFEDVTYDHCEDADIFLSSKWFTTHGLIGRGLQIVTPKSFKKSVIVEHDQDEWNIHRGKEAEERSSADDDSSFASLRSLVSDDEEDNNKTTVLEDILEEDSLPHLIESTCKQSKLGFACKNGDGSNTCVDAKEDETKSVVSTTTAATTGSKSGKRSSRSSSPSTSKAPGRSRLSNKKRRNRMKKARR